MRLRVGVLATDQAGEHARVWCFRLSSDQGQAHAWFGAHGEAAHNLDMGVAGAKKDDVGFDGVERLHGGRLAQVVRVGASGASRPGVTVEPLAKLENHPEITQYMP